MKPVGAEIKLTIGCDRADFEIAVGDAIATARRRLYLVIGARQMRSRRQPSMWAVRCIVAEWPPPPGVRVFSLTWWKR